MLLVVDFRGSVKGASLQRSTIKVYAFWSIYQPFITDACGACRGVLMVVFGMAMAGAAVFVP